MKTKKAVAWRLGLLESLGFFGSLGFLSFLAAADSVFGFLNFHNTNTSAK